MPVSLSFQVIQHHTAPDIVKWLDEKVRGIESEIEQSKGTNLLGAGAETDSDGAWRAAEQGSKEGSKQSDETSRPSDKAATSAKSRKKTKDHQPRSLRRVRIIQISECLLAMYILCFPAPAWTGLTLSLHAQSPTPLRSARNEHIRR